MNVDNLLITEHNAERTLIGQLLVDPFAIKDCTNAKLMPEHFLNIVYGTLYREMVKQENFSLETLLAEFESRGGEQWEVWLKKGVELSKLMMDAHFMPNLTGLAQNVIKQHWKRNVLVTTDKMQVYTNNLNGTPTPEYMNTLNAQWQKMMEAYQAERPQLGISGADVLAEKYLAQVAGEEPDKVRRIPTGLKPLDSVLGGGLRRKTHTGVLAASSTGKTILLKQMATEMQTAGFHVVYYMLEEDADFIVSRMQAQLLKVNSWYVEENQTPPNPHCPKCRTKPATEQAICNCRTEPTWMKTYQERFRKIVDAWGKNSPTIIESAHVDTWADELRAIHAQRPIDAVFVDYGQRVRFNGDQLAAHEKFANDLTDMSKELDAVFVTALQVGKAGNAGFTAPPKPNDIRGTSAWFNAFRVMISLFRPLEAVDEYGNEVFSVNGSLSFVKMRSSLSGTPHPIGIQLRSEGLVFAPLTGQRE